MTNPAMPSSQEREAALFALALDKPFAERPAFLRAACGNDESLRVRLEALLAAHDEPDLLFPTQVEAARSTIKLDLAEAPDEAVGQALGRYKLLERVGEGGCGVVYVAEQTEPVRRRVALKIIKLGMDTKQVVARFEAERQALAMMDHPNIAKVLDAGTTETGRPYFVMELVRGIRITDYCEQNNLPTKERLDLFIKVCQAIQHAHQKGIIHRDVKPSNILVTMHDGVPVPKVIDFGIAKATEGRLTDATVYTQLHQFIGTPAYMSPEQAEMSGLDIDTRSDIYSLGVVLYELLAGSTPFDAKELVESGIDAMRKTIREKEPARPSTRLTQELATRNSGAAVRKPKPRSSDPPEFGRRDLEVKERIALLRGDLDWIVMKCLEKDRTRRYETANGLSADLKRHLNHEPVVARPPSATYRFQKAFRRNRLVFAAGTAIALALVAGIGVSTWQAAVATRSKNQAIRAETQKAEEARIAKAARQQAETERARAEASELSAQRLLFWANMDRAPQEWEGNNVTRLRQMLAEASTYPGRGFEWFYWQRLAHSELRTLHGHAAELRSVAFSPDAQRIVTGSGDRTAKVWDAATGKELVTLRGHSAAINSVAFSPDGLRIVTGSGDQMARVWDSANGRGLLTLHGHLAQISSAAFSPDGRRILTGSGDRTARVWEAASGKELLTLERHSAAIKCAAFSRDGQRMVTGSEDRTAKVWDAATGKELLTFQGHEGPIESATFSPDGQRIVTGSGDRTVRVWEAATGRELLLLRGHSGQIAHDAPAISVAISPDGQRIVTGSSDQTSARVWEAATGKELLVLKGHSAGLQSVAFSPDGQRIVTGSTDQMAKVWDAAGANEPLSIKGQTSDIWSVAFSPDGQRIAIGCQDGTAEVWETVRGKPLSKLSTLIAGARPRVASLAFSPDGQRIVTSFDRAARVWDAASGQELLTLKGHNSGNRGVAFSPDGRRILTGNEDRTAKMWDAASGQELLTLRGHDNEIWAVAFSPDGKRIVTGSGDRTARVWDAGSGQELLTLRGHSGIVMSVSFSPDGQRIVTSSEDRMAKVWEAASGKELLTLSGHSARIQSAAFSPDSRRIVTGSADHIAKVWDAASGRELLALKGHQAQVESVAFSPDGRRILTGGGRTAKLWEAATAQQVGAWVREEETAAESLVILRREQAVVTERERTLRARDPGPVKQWLVLAPIPIQSRTINAAVDEEPIPDEADLRPRVDDRVQVGQGERIWRAVTALDYRIDFNQLIGEMTERSVGYAVCYIQSTTEQKGLLMKVGSDDQAKIYLNGEEIYRQEEPRSYVADEDVAAGVEFRAGLNILVFKVVNIGAGWEGSVRFTDPLGHAVKGLAVTLDPGQPDATENARRAAVKAARLERRMRARGLLSESQIGQAAFAFARGLALAESGDPGHGMIWMIEALKPPSGDQPAFEEMIRLNLSGWSQLFELDAARRVSSPPRDEWGNLNTNLAINASPKLSGRWQPLSRPFAQLRQTNPGESQLSQNNGDILFAEIRRSGSEPVQSSAGGSTLLYRDDFQQSRSLVAVRLREAATGFPLGRPLRLRGNAMWDLALSRDGRLAATTVYTSLDDWQLFAGETTLWNALTGQRLHGPLVPNMMMRALELSPDGKILVASTQGKIHFWNTETGQPDPPDIPTEDNAVALVFSPDGNTLAVGISTRRGVNFHARLYDVRTRQPLADPFPAGTANAWCHFLAFTPDGQSLVTGGLTIGITVTDLRSMQPRYAPIPCANTVHDVKISADGSRFAISEKSGTLRVFDLRTGRQIGREMQQTAGSHEIALNADGTLLVSGSMAGTVRLWHVPTSQPLGPPLAHRYGVWDVRFSPDGRSFSSTDRRGITKHWQVPKPALGPPAALQAQLELWLHTKLTNGEPIQITDQEGRQRQTFVDGFPPGSVWFSDPVSPLHWHEAEAGDCEVDGNWDGAWWHLDRLVAARPDDWQLRARRGRIQILRGDLAAAEADFIRAAELNGQKPLLDWFAHCAYAGREQQTWKSSLYFLERLVAAEPEAWQWRADQEEAFEKLGRKTEAQAAFLKAIELCRQSMIPALAADFVRNRDWAALSRELSRGEKTGWLSIEDWRLWARSARELGDQAALAAILSRFKERAGPDCPLLKQITP